MKRRSARSAAFTIIEVTMAVGVLAFGIATSITALNFGFRAMDNARNTTIASQILQSVMEDTRMLPYENDATSSTSIESLQSSQGANGSTVTLDTSFTGTDPVAVAMISRFTVTRLVSDVSGYTDMKKIDLTCRWNGIDGRSHSLSYTSYYGKYGLHDYYID